MTEAQEESHPASFRLPVSVHRQLKVLAVTRGVTLGAIVTDALREYLDRETRSPSLLR